MEDEKMFDLEIISPDRQFYEGKVSFLEMRTSEGDIGVYKEHIPMTCILIPGLVKMYEDGSDEPKKAIVHAGFVEILPKKVTIMAEVAEWPDEIDINRAEEARIRAERRINEGGEGVNLERAEAALRRSLARIEALK
ncbi:MAG: ATP synthase F1 subunit epsilon [Lachnospiraceae bacterium]|nr:ATP synthase F1 subunit epsilon [Lachnospiraceae bacterium]